MRPPLPAARLRGRITGPPDDDECVGEPQEALGLGVGERQADRPDVERADVGQHLTLAEVGRESAEVRFGGRTAHLGTTSEEADEDNRILASLEPPPLDEDGRADQWQDQQRESDEKRPEEPGSHIEHDADHESGCPEAPGEEERTTQEPQQCGDPQRAIVVEAPSGGWNSMSSGRAYCPPLRQIWGAEGFDAGRSSWFVSSAERRSSASGGPVWVHAELERVNGRDGRTEWRVKSGSCGEGGGAAILPGVRRSSPSEFEPSPPKLALFRGRGPSPIGI